ncbi:MAG: type II toxin-antitoxin system HipA family toxin [bacterium]|nr:type II toxin-antitoxin system HipA family toxin [bacterium]
MEALNVTWDGALVGRLEPGPGRDMTFRYASAWLSSPRARAISLSLPLGEEPFVGAVPGAWFANLLPEGDVRAHVARKLGVSERNEFALLGGVGGDCAGALRLLPDAAPADEEAGLTPLAWAELEAKIAATPRPSLLALVFGDRELRLSLAGAQDKLPVHLAGDVLSLPTGASASTHLLKIAGSEFPDLVQNELFCLTLAREVGLDVPPARMAATKTPILVASRYDRRVTAAGVVQRVHQEDFCQALGLPSESKYENEGGPSLSQLFGVIARGSHSPLPDKRDLLGWVLFNTIIGNADAHAKNLSLLYDVDEESRPRLAPFYDLVCTAVYGQLSDKHAQKIGGEYRWRHTSRRHWERLAADIDVNSNFLCATGLELCERVEARAADLAREIGREHAGSATLERIVRVIEQRGQRLRSVFAD